MLRPEFTHRLAERLLRGESVNLQGAHGLGRRQTVEELRSLLPEYVFVSHLDIRRDKTDPDKWLSESMEVRERKILILHNFDELDIEKASNRRFVERLAVAGTRTDTSLLLVTVSLPGTWNLRIDTLPIPPLP